MLAESTAAPGAFGVERLGVVMSPSEDPREALADARRDPANLVAVAKHEMGMAPVQPWEREKVGTGAPSFASFGLPS